MKGFIEVTNARSALEGRKVLIAVALVTSVTVERNKTLIFQTDGEQVPWTVSESYEEVKKLIEEAEE